MTISLLSFVAPYSYSASSQPPRSSLPKFSKVHQIIHYIAAVMDFGYYMMTVIVSTYTICRSSGFVSEIFNLEEIKSFEVMHSFSSSFLAGLRLSPTTNMHSTKSYRHVPHYSSSTSKSCTRKWTKLRYTRVDTLMMHTASVVKAACSFGSAVPSLSM
jgi:hypothetical protein